MYKFNVVIFDKAGHLFELHYTRYDGTNIQVTKEYCSLGMLGIDRIFVPSGSLSKSISRL